MIRNYGLPTIIVGALLGGLAFSSLASEDPKVELLLAQVYGSTCQTPTQVCSLDYEDIVGSPCECYGEYGSVVEY